MELKTSIILIIAVAVISIILLVFKDLIKGLKKIKMSRKNQKIVVVSLCVCAIICFIFFEKIIHSNNVKKTSDNVPQNQKVIETITEEEKQRIAEEEKVKKEEELQKQIQREINTLKNFDSSQYKTSVESISVELAFLPVWVDMINEAKESDSQELNNLSEQLTQSVKQFQIKEFPVMRKEYGKLMNNVLWEHNIEVKVLGSYNSTIELIGGYFADNANIKEMQQEIQEMLTQLRFDRVNYKWYKYASEYQYYKLDSTADNIVIRIK